MRHKRLPFFSLFMYGAFNIFGNYTYNNFVYIYIYVYIYAYMIVWNDVALAEEVISHKYKINFTYFIDTSELIIHIDNKFH